MGNRLSNSASSALDLSNNNATSTNRTLSGVRSSITSAAQSVAEIIYDESGDIQRIPMLETAVGPDGKEVCEFDGAYYLPQRHMLLVLSTTENLTEEIMERVENDMETLASFIGIDSNVFLDGASTDDDNRNGVARCIESVVVQDARDGDAVSFHLQQKAFRTLPDLDKDVNIWYCVLYKTNSLSSDRPNTALISFVDPTSDDAEGFRAAIKVTYSESDDPDYSDEESSQTESSNGQEDAEEDNEPKSEEDDDTKTEENDEPKVEKDDDTKTEENDEPKAENT